MVGRLYSVQCRLYSFLERPKGTWHIIYHLGIFAYVILTLALSAVMTLEEEHGTVVEKFVFSMEITMAVYFTIEFSLRIFCVGINAKFQGWRGRLRYMSKFIVIIDIVILCATLCLLIFGTQNGKFLGSATIQNLRFLQILRLLRVDRDASTWKMMENIFKIHQAELISAYYLSAIGLLIMCTVVYLIEDNHSKAHPTEPATFSNYGEALWWGVITVMAVGYGDVVPKTWVSKLVTMIFALLCVSLFMLVSSVIGVGLTLSVQERERRRKLSKQLPLAATVIQNFYRQRLISTNFHHIQYYSKTLTQSLVTHEIRCAASTTQNPRTSSRTKRKTSSGIQKLLHLQHVIPEEHENPVRPKDVHEMLRLSTKNIGHTSLTTVSESDSDYGSSTNSSPGPETLGYNAQDTISSCHSANAYSPCGEDLACHPFPVLLNMSDSATRKYQLCLIAISRFKFLAAKKRFKIARRPYELQDISDQHSECELTQFHRLREVQHKLESLVGKPGLSLLSKSKKESAVSERLELVEGRTEDMDKKVDLILHLATQLSDRLTFYERMATISSPQTSSESSC